jgi:hypothetical protein
MGALLQIPKPLQRQYPPLTITKALGMPLPVNAPIEIEWTPHPLAGDGGVAMAPLGRSEIVFRDKNLFDFLLSFFPTVKFTMLGRG